jgi:folate-binding protein YgfZ
MSDSLSTTISSTTTTLPAVDAADYAALTTSTGLITRARAGVLRLTDADRHDFLQRMTTNNIAVLRPGMSAVTVLTSSTARTLFVFTVIARSEDLILLPAPGQGQALARHLRGQIFFMDKVKLHDVTHGFTGNDDEGWMRLRLMGPNAAETLLALGMEATSLLADGVIVQDDLLVVAQPHYETPGFELVVRPSRAAALTDTLVGAGARIVAEAAVEVRRVELGRPAPGAELTEEYTPLEAGLGWACADNKGCYTGQEIIARQITYDKVTKTLVGLHLSAPVAVGSEVMAENRPVGTVTSTAHSPSLDACVALAVVKRPHNTPGALLHIGAATATVTSLPVVAA